MTPEERLQAILTGYAPLVSVVGTRIHPGVLQQGLPLPAVVVQFEREPISTIHGTVLGYRERCEVQGHAATYTAAANLADLITDALVASGEVPAAQVRGAYVEETGNYMSAIEVVI